jgi:hypothetical protein
VCGGSSAVELHPLSSTLRVSELHYIDIQFMCGFYISTEFKWCFVWRSVGNVRSQASHRSFDCRSNDLFWAV